jgi:isoleucyl-tRNA synthetase
MMAPFTPFIAEALYQGMFRHAAAKPHVTIHALDWPKPNNVWRNEDLERRLDICQRVVSAGAMARMKAGLKLRQPVKTVNVITGKDEVRDAVLRMKVLLLDQMNTRSLNVSPPSESKERVTLRTVPIMATLGPELKSRAAKVAQKLTAMDPEDLRKQLSQGKVEIEIDSEKVTIYDKYVNFVEEAEDTEPAADFEGGRVSIDTTLSPDEIADGLARDLVRRIQQMRKEMDLRVDDFVNVDVVASADETVSSVKSRHDYILGEVRARTLVVEQSDPAKAHGELVKEWSIGDDVFSIGLRRHQKRATSHPRQRHSGIRKRRKSH